MKQKHLETLPIFARLPREDRKRVADRATVVMFEPGETIVEQDAFSFEFFAIAKGTGAVFREGGEIARLGPGDIFGELGVMPQGGLSWGRRHASVVCGERMTAIAIAGYDLRELVREIPALREAIEQAAAQRSGELAHAAPPQED